MGKHFQQLLSSDEMVRLEIKRVEQRVSDTIREEELQREDRQRFRLKSVELLARPQEIAKLISQFRNEISQTKQRLEA